jgi:signal transduction histidine kinase
MDGFSKALLEDYGELLPAEGRSFLDQITLASRRMAGLIDGLLQLSRVTRGNLARAPVDLSGLAEGLLKELAKGEPGRQVHWELEPGIVAQGDPRMLEAALGNLLGNAWKYTARTPEPRIRLDTVLEEGVRWIRIQDNGCGFDMAHSEKLFKPFQRLHRQDEFPGLGIGLATVQRIVSRHGGSLKASAAPGLGASFLLSLPQPIVTEHP